MLGQALPQAGLSQSGVAAAHAPPDFSSFLSSGQFSDVLLVCRVEAAAAAGEICEEEASTGRATVEIPAHRLVLAAQSEIFSAGLSGYWAGGSGGVGENKQQQQQQLDMPEDADVHTVRHLLNYIYGAGVALSSGSAREWVALLCLAHRYMLHGLVLECCAALLRAVADEPEHAADLLEVADLLGVGPLWCGVATVVLERGSAGEEDADGLVEAVLVGFAEHAAAAAGARE